MFDPSFFNFDFLGFALMASAVIPPLFGDIESWLPDFGKWIGDQYEKILNFLESIWGKVSEFFAEILNSFLEIWRWLADAFYAGLEYIWGSICAAGETIYRYILKLADWAVDFFIEAFLWVFDQLPEITLPDGFDEGLTYLVEWGLLLNNIFPIEESLILFSLYVTILTVLIVYKLIVKVVFAILEVIP